MQRSESLVKLTAALLKARVKFEKIVRDKTATVKNEKASYSYKYADLSDVLDATVDPLAENGLVLTQWPGTNATGKPMVETLLLHESGEFICGAMDLPAMGDRATPQQLGSLITYIRRYCACGALGIASQLDDDDGKRAEKGAKDEMNPGALADHLAAIETAEDVKALEKAFFTAKAAAGKDKVAEARIIAMKNARYKAIAPRTKPANGGAA
jgi:hypothetical protein